MSAKTIIYGDILSPHTRRILETTFSNDRDSLIWCATPQSVQQADQCPLVFVDLDNPAFAEPSFLVGLARGKSKIIGKSANPSDNAALQVAPLGISEILDADQCLKRLQSFLESLHREAEPPPKTGLTVDALVGSSASIADIRHIITLLSEVDFPNALILGETGTGKGFLAKIIHETGTRSAYNMVEVNCSAIPDDLFEAELFGHTRGAFTDAKSEKMGLFEYAQNGTLFLDEVGNLSASAQAKLLKILEDKKLRRVGDVTQKDINVRVVAATNLDLRKTIEAGRFREDLYYRLNLLTIEIPPLRQRPEDIPDLATHFLHFFSALYNKPGVVFEDDAINELKSHSWPGNVRELSNVMEKAILLLRGRIIRGRDISAALKKSRISAADRKRISIELPPHGKPLDSIEAQVVGELLNIFDWNKSKVAEYLKISRPRLRRIIETHHLDQNRRQA